MKIKGNKYQPGDVVHFTPKGLEKPKFLVGVVQPNMADGRMYYVKTEDGLLFLQHESRIPNVGTRAEDIALWLNTKFRFQLVRPNYSSQAEPWWIYKPDIEAWTATDEQVIELAKQSG